MKLIKQFLLPTLTSSALLFLNANTHAEVKDGKDLYELAGPDAAFVRLVNLNNSRLTANLGDKSLTAETLCSVSKTQAILAGRHELQGDGWKWERELKPGEIYTIVVNGQSATELSAPLDRNPMKANFEVFNLQFLSTLDVLTVAGSRPIFDAIPAQSRKSRTLNPLRVELQLINGMQEIIVPPIAFARGKTTSLMVCGSDTSLISTYTTE